MEWSLRLRIDLATMITLTLLAINAVIPEVSSQTWSNRSMASVAINLSRHICRAIRSSSHHQIHSLVDSNNKIHFQSAIPISSLSNLTILAFNHKTHSLRKLRKRKVKLIRKVDLLLKSSSTSRQLQPTIMMVLKGFLILIRKATFLRQVVIMRVNKDLRVERGPRQSSISRLTITRKSAVILTLTSTICRIIHIVALIQTAKWVKDHRARGIIR